MDLSIKDIISYDLNVYHLRKNSWNSYRWGKQQSYNIMGIYRSNIIVLKLLPIFIDLKKIIYITNNISYNMGSCLSCFLLRSGLVAELDEPEDVTQIIKGFYFAFIDQWYGLISNFYMFLNYKKFFFKEVKRITNYDRDILPNIVFMSTGSWKYYDKFFLGIYRSGVLSIKSGGYLQKDINICYNILIGNSFRIHELLKSIYLFYKELRKFIW